MLFNSIEFFIFLGVFFAAWPFMRRRDNRRWAYLIVVSFFFYGWWDWRFLFLLTGTGLNDYLAGLAMVKWPRCKRLFLGASITGNLGSLMIFKYLDFSITNVNWLMKAFGIDHPLPLAHLILPVGISFYTFQSLSYTIDVYKGRLVPTRNILHFFAFLSLFPQLLAGPIVRATDLLPQLRTWKDPTATQRWDGLRLVFYGYFKKAVLADNLAPIVNAAFSSTAFVNSGAYWWVVIVCFAFQIYCDFSGYSDIARGLAKWMGYEFIVNFEHPYISSSIREFWTRWHISLSTWYRDYVYIGLGGSRGSAAAGSSQHVDHDGQFGHLARRRLDVRHLERPARPVPVAGTTDAMAAAADRPARRPPRGHAHRLFPGMHRVGVLPAQSFDQAAGVLGTMLNPGHWNGSEALVLLAGRAPWLLGAVFLRHLYFHLRLDQRRQPAGWPARSAEVAAMVVVLWCCLFLRGPGSAFVYFQF